jgi:hypothetical protein
MMIFYTALFSNGKYTNERLIQFCFKVYIIFFIYFDKKN